MSHTIVGPAGVETRQAMIRVWLAISAVWIAFWLSIAALIVVTGEIADPLSDQLGLFSLIVVTPPLVLLAVGALSRWVFEAILQKTNGA